MYKSILFLLILYATATAAVPSMISYQGRLTDPLGNPVADGNYQITFSVYGVLSGGTAMWTSGAQTVGVEKGLFNYNLGSSGALPDSIFSKYTQAYLGIKVGADPEIAPRTQLVSVGYAFQSLRGDSAKYAITVADDAITSAKIADGTIQFGDIGQNGAASGQVPKWNGSGWAAANDENGGAGTNYWTLVDSVIYTRDFLGIARGGAGNVLSGDSSHTHVNLGVACTTGFAYNDYYCVVGGGYGNRASNSFGTIGGGANNLTSGQCGVVGGGWGNVAYTISPYTFIGGGYKNRIEGDVSASVICGGDSNKVQTHIAAIVGGLANEITSEGYNGFLGGGEKNKVDANTGTLVGGYWNTVTGREAFIGGGRLHNAGGMQAAIAGGMGNTANGECAAVGGGGGNVASGLRATVGGGSQDSATGFCATVPGGILNAATGFSSLAAGYGAKARHPGTFVWADSTGANFQSTAINQFLIRAGGGVGIGTNSPTTPLQVAGTIYSTSGGFKFPDGTTQTTAATSGTASGWVDDGTVVRLETGTDKVGVGTSSPAEMLDVNGLLHMRDNIKLNGNWLSNDGGDEGVYVAADGKVGIGTNSPNVPLNVQGGTDVSLSGGGYITLGSVTGRNMTLDDNEIMVRDNGAASTLVLNSGSGDVQICPDATGRVGIGTQNPATQLDVNGDLALRAGSFAASSGLNNNISIGQRSFVRITGPAAAYTITGIAGGSDGKMLVLYNTTGFTMTIANENANSTAANRITTMAGADDATAGTGNVTLIYDATAQRWIVTSLKP